MEEKRFGILSSIIDLIKSFRRKEYDSTENTDVSKFSKEDAQLLEKISKQRIEFGDRLWSILNTGNRKMENDANLRRKLADVVKKELAKDEGQKPKEHDERY